ncbi:MAG: flagellar motor switch protein FliG [Desulfobacterales bacterium]|nr:flagellar motor switch protein FliG [Desulfobacterales bacterium]
MDAKNLPGSLKAAILIHSMGKEASQAILNSLQEEERRLVQTHLAQLVGAIPPEIVESVAQEFTQMNRRPPARSGSTVGAGGKEKTRETSGDPASLKAMRSIEPEQLVDMIKDEHPQTIAVIIVHLTPQNASLVLSKLPDELKVDVALRIAGLDKVIAGMVEDIDRVFEDILTNKPTAVVHKTGGVGHLAELLNLSDGLTGEMILNQIEENNPELAAQIKQKMFVFDDLVLVDNKGLQKVLRKVETGQLAVALKGASEEAKAKIFGNMSSRASEMLQEEIETMGAVRMKEVEEAQQVITKIIQEMETKGEIVISGRGGEEFIA